MGSLEQTHTEYGPLAATVPESAWIAARSGGSSKVDKSKEVAISYKALVSTVRREGFILNEIKNH